MPHVLIFDGDHVHRQPGQASTLGARLVEFDGRPRDATLGIERLAIDAPHLAAAEGSKSFGRFTPPLADAAAVSAAAPLSLGAGAGIDGHGVEAPPAALTASTLGEERGAVLLLDITNITPEGSSDGCFFVEHLVGAASAKNRSKKRIYLRAERGDAERTRENDVPELWGGGNARSAHDEQQ